MIKTLSIQRLFWKNERERKKIITDWFEQISVLMQCLNKYGNLELLIYVKSIWNWN